MNATELKACPFCNGRPAMDSHRAYRAMNGKMGTSVAIYCTGCNADMSLCREDMPECNGDELIEMLAAEWNKRAGDREPATSKTESDKHVGISDVFGGFVIKIEPFMLWEAARSKAMTSNNWHAAMLELERALRRETDETGSNRVYEMLEACLEELEIKGVVRPMTDDEVSKDADCPLYPPNVPS